MRASLCTSAACALALLPVKQVLRNMPIRDSQKIHDVVIIGLVSLVCEGDLPDVRCWLVASFAVVHSFASVTSSPRGRE